MTATQPQLEGDPRSQIQSGSEEWYVMKQDIVWDALRATAGVAIALLLLSSCASIVLMLMGKSPYG